MAAIDTSKLKPWQVEPARHLFELLSARRNCVDLSDTGIGKTYTASAVLAALDTPTLAVVPKSAITPWRRAAAHFDTSFDVLNYDMLRTGYTPYGRWECPLSDTRVVQSKCKNCQCIITEESDPCYCTPTGEHELEHKVLAHDYGKFIWHPAIDTIVFDEVHRCGAMGSLQADMLIAARRQKKRVLALSATAACTPLQMRALGYVLDLHTLDERKDRYGSPGYASGLSFYSWARRYGCKHTTWGGFQWLVSNDEKQRQIMAELSNTIVPARGVRVRKADVPGFPTVSIHCKLYDIEEPERVDELYAAMAESLAGLEETMNADVDPDNPLTRILRERQKVELLKVPLFEELTRDFLAKGCSVAVFLNFTDSIRQLAKRLKTKSIIDGTPEFIGRRDQVVDDFESDKSRVVVVNTAAGSECIGLRDLRGEFPRVGLVSPTFSARVMRQLFGRLPRDGSKSHSTYYVVFAAGTVEQDICISSGEKMDNIDALNDADLTPKNLLEARSNRRARKARK